MAESYLGEIRMFAGNYAPIGWALCNGQMLSIAENPDLFSLIATTYGGDGIETFALPDLRGRIPIHMGRGSSGINYVIGDKGGVETVTLTNSEMPIHTHTPIASNVAGKDTPAGNIWATLPFTGYSTNTTGPQRMKSTAISVEGGSQPHDNMMPYLAVNFIISLNGIYPSQS
ncbi:phage tail protein [Brevibacillus ginsengisoli]|uniref:phage tail protein n=1 Tax=Brevibacillus ginsengisoli TaxID=363854 RepID=UPI003CFA1B15